VISDKITEKNQIYLNINLLYCHCYVIFTKLKIISNILTEKIIISKENYITFNLSFFFKFRLNKVI